MMLLVDKNIAIPGFYIVIHRTRNTCSVISINLSVERHTHTQIMSQRFDGFVGV